MFQGWWIVGTHFTVQLFVSGFFVYSFPILFDSVIEAFDTDRTTVNGLPTAAALLGLIVSPVAGPLVDRWTAKGLILIGVAALVAGLLATSIATDVRVFIASGAICFSIAQGLLGPMTGSAVVSRWFTARRGRALGFAAIGTSVGGMLVPIAVAYGIEAIGWRPTLQVLAAVVAVVCFPLVAFRFWDEPAVRGLPPEPAADVDASRAGSEQAAPLSNLDILRMPAFWFFSLSLALFLAVYSATLANLGQIGADFGLGTLEIPHLVTTLAAFGIVGKIGFGYLADRMPLRVGLWAAIAFAIAALAILTRASGLAGMIVGSMLMGLSTGGMLPVWNAMVPPLFGLANFGRAMGLMAPVIGLVVTPSFAVAGYVRDTTGSYVPALHGGLALLVVAMLLLGPIRLGSGAAPGER